MLGRIREIGIFLFLIFFFVGVVGQAEAYNCDENLAQIARSRGLEPGKDVGIAVVVLVMKGDYVLMGERSSGYWGFIAGTYEEGKDKTIRDCAHRETGEETFLRIKNLKFRRLHTAYSPEKGMHYFTAVLTARVRKGIPRVREETKAKQWKWIKWGEFPSPVFPPTESLLKARFSPFETKD